MKAFHKNRMQKMIDFLRELPPSNFDMKDFVSLKGGRMSNLSDEERTIATNKLFKAKEVHNCGTTACACGYLPVIFPKYYKYSGGSFQARDKSGKLDSVVAFLGLDSDNAFDYLFMQEFYHPSKRGPKSVASRLELVLKNNGKIPETYKEYYG